MTSWPVCVCLVFLTKVALSDRKTNFLRIGAIFDRNDDWGRYAFKAAIKVVNQDDSVLPDIELVGDTAFIPPTGAFGVQEKVCQLARRGVVGIVGPTSPTMSNHVQSLCDTLEIPHISARWDPQQRRSSCLVNLFPHPSVLARASAELVRASGWTGFTLLYDDFNALRRMGELLKIADDKTNYIISVRQVKGKPGDEDNFRHMLQEVKHSEEKNFVIEVSTDKLYEVLLQAQQVGLVGTDYTYIITSLDLHSIDLENFKWAGTNITGLRIFNPESTHFKDVMEMMMKIKRDEKHGVEAVEEEENGDVFVWEPSKKRYAKTEFSNSKSNPQTELSANIPPVEAMLIFDAVLSFADALHSLGVTEMKSVHCHKKMAWESGYSVINYMKMSEHEGLSGSVKFDNEGFRTDFSLDIMELTKSGLEVKGNWSAYGGVTIDHREEESSFIKESDDLRNYTFVVIIALTHPYGMLRESSSRLEGNNRFEGFGIDLISELSEMTGFNYTFRVQEDKSSGNPIELPNGTKVWNGMIGEVLAGRADLAIADITITREREHDVDFTDPFMSLGISILYRKPAAAPPSLFSFLSPFSYEVWGYMLSAYLGVSFLLYIMARISPAEWTNPYPCIEEPTELENQFSMSNSLWFTIGSLMQQGSELAPIAVSTRLVASIWWFFTLIMVSSYTANLAAFLTIEQKVEAFRDVKELSEHETIRYGAKRGGATANFFRDSHDPVYQKMWGIMSANSELMPETNEAGVDRVDSTTDYAFLMESTSIEYEMERRCNLFKVGKELDEKGYGIAMRQNSTYRNILGRSVVKLRERGKLNELKKKWWREKRGGGSCQEDPPSGADDLGLDNVGGVFVVLLGGCIFAVFLAFGELSFAIYMNEDKVSFKEEFKKEMKFIMQCHGTVKPRRQLISSSSSSSSRRGTDSPNPSSRPSRSRSRSRISVARSNNRSLIFPTFPLQMG